MFVKFIAIENVEKLAAEIQRLGGVDAVKYSMEKAMNDFLLKSYPEEYKQIYAGQYGEAWRRALVELGYGDIGKLQAPFVVPLQRFFMDYGLDLKLFNELNEKVLRDESWVPAVLEVFSSLKLAGKRIDALPFDVTVSAQGDNLSQLIVRKHTDLKAQDNQRIQQEKEYQDKEVFFLKHLGDPAYSSLIGTKKAYKEFLALEESSNYFWQKKFSQGEKFDYPLDTKHEITPITIALAKFLQKYNISLEHFNELMSEVLVRKLSLSCVEPALDEVCSGQASIESVTIEEILQKVVVLDQEEIQEL